LKKSKKVYRLNCGRWLMTLSPLPANGKQPLFLVGGVVRDLLLGKNQ